MRHGCSARTCGASPRLNERWTSPREEREPGRETEPERLVVEAVAGIRLETPREVRAPGQLDTEARAREELAVVVATARRAGDADERPHVHDGQGRRGVEIRRRREVIERADLEVVDEHTVRILDLRP